MRVARWFGPIVAIVIVALPFAVKAYQLDFLIFLFINVVVVVSYRLVTITGEWSLSHVVIMGVGAYASAIGTKQLGLPVLAAMPIAGLVSALIAYILSFPLFRMKGFYFLIGSFAAGEAIRLTWSRFRFPFGGPKGITLIPAPELTLPGFGTVSLGTPVIYYFMTVAIVVLCLWVMYRLERSKIGLTLEAIHWKDVLAESVGINTWRYRTLSFVTASFFAGIGGSLLGHYIGTINPDRFGMESMLYVLVWTIVGGTRTFYGPIIGVVALSILDEVFRGLAELRPALYGILLIATMRFLPHGLESLPEVFSIARGRLRTRTDRAPAAAPDVSAE
jgi:branched-chain amino acid transport system permease protein